MELQRDEKTTALRTEAKRSRFRIEKLEERIAPAIWDDYGFTEAEWQAELANLGFATDAELAAAIDPGIADFSEPQPDGDCPRHS
jgi:hypothetical protein